MNERENKKRGERLLIPNSAAHGRRNATFEILNLNVNCRFY